MSVKCVLCGKTDAQIPLIQDAISARALDYVCVDCKKDVDLLLELATTADVETYVDFRAGFAEDYGRTQVIDDLLRIADSKRLYTVDNKSSPSEKHAAFKPMDKNSINNSETPTSSIFSNESTGASESLKKDDPVVESNASYQTSTSLSRDRRKRITAIICAVFITAAIVTAAVLYKTQFTQFQRAKRQALYTAGGISSGKGYFTLDTNWFEKTYDELDVGQQHIFYDQQQKCLEAIKLTNKALGFAPSLYDDMVETNVLMGWQRKSNGKYTVEWKYNPRTGLEVSYIEN